MVVRFAVTKDQALVSVVSCIADVLFNGHEILLVCYKKEFLECLNRQRVALVDRVMFVLLIFCQC